MTRPFEVLSEVGALDWPTVRVGLCRGWITPEEVGQFAVDEIVASVEPIGVELATLASAGSLASPDLETLVVEMVARSDDEITDERAIRRWLYGVLVALDRQPLSDANKFERLQEIFDDFDAPTVLRGTYRYVSPLEARAVEPFRPLDSFRAAISELEAEVVGPAARDADPS